MKGKPSLEATVWKTFDMLKLKENKHVDDVLSLLNDFVTNRACVDEQVISLFPFIDGRLEEDENLYISLFPLINTLILLGNFEA